MEGYLLENGDGYAELIDIGRRLSRKSQNEILSHVLLTTNNNNKKKKQEIKQFVVPEETSICIPYSWQPFDT